MRCTAANRSRRLSTLYKRRIWRYRRAPAHVVRAFAQALKELDEEGGIAARHQRYLTNQRVLADGMAKLGFRALIDPTVQSPIITSFMYPEHPKFDFQVYYDMLKERGFVIYPGKVSVAQCYRIGNIGHIFPSDMETLVGHIADVLGRMGVL